MKQSLRSLRVLQLMCAATAVSLLVAGCGTGSGSDSVADADPTPSTSSSGGVIVPGSSDLATPEPGTSESPSPSPPPAPTGPPMTSCTSDVHIGESTSEGLISDSYLPDVKEQLPAQLKDVGVKHVQTDISGARSIVERYEGQPNGEDAVDAKKAAGYHGCWTIAMGTNEAANQAAGSTVDSKQRIEIMMKAIGPKDPVLWLTTSTLIKSGSYYNDSNMQEFDQTLIKACKRYPNLRVYDWQSEVKDLWFISDGIHYTSFGYKQRAHRIAQALAVAFPKDAPPSASCVVDSGVSPNWGEPKKSKEKSKEPKR